VLNTSSPGDDLDGLIELARDYMVLMAAVVFGGGLMGYIKASSKASLISGTVSALVLGITFWISMNGRLGEGLIASFVVYSLLDIIFVLRLIKTKKFMPAGLILILCVIGQGLALAGHGAIMSSPNYRG
jgi:uncharacterized membrane protein (UPF0136 family)